MIFLLKSENNNLAILLFFWQSIQIHKDNHRSILPLYIYLNYLNNSFSNILSKKTYKALLKVECYYIYYLFAKKLKISNCIKKMQWVVSIHRPSGYEPDALTTELQCITILWNLTFLKPGPFFRLKKVKIWIICVLLIF